MWRRIFVVMMVVIAVGCSNDDEPIDESICTIEAFKEAIESETTTGNLVSNVFEGAGRFLIVFNDGSKFHVCSDIVFGFTIEPEDNEIIFDLSDGNQYIIEFAGGFKIELTTNPSGFSPLTAKLNITTFIPGEIEIRVVGKHGASSDLVHRFENVGLNPEIPVLGLYQDYDNQVMVSFYSLDNELLEADTLTITTPSVNFFDPQISILKAERQNMEPGEFHLVSSLSFWQPNIPYMFDTYGEIRWVLDFRNHPGLSNLFYDVGIERLQNGNLYFGDLVTDLIYEVDMFGNILNSWDMPGYAFHHNVQEKPNGNFLVTVNKYTSTHNNGFPSVEDYVIEIERQTGNIIKEWDFKQFLDEDRIALIDKLSVEPVDWLHINAVIYDESDNSIIISGRHQGMAKVDYNDSLIWVMGAHKGWGTNRQGNAVSNYLLNPIDANGTPYGQAVKDGDVDGADFEWNWFQHAPCILPNGNILLFDNGEERNFSGLAPKYSRAVEYEVDEQNKTIKQIWQYGKERGNETYSRIISDVDYLPQTGNILFGPGTAVFNGSTFQGGRIVEIDYTTKEVYFEAIIGSAGMAFHRIERMKMYE